jgi:hypothetical protein
MDHHRPLLPLRGDYLQIFLQVFIVIVINVVSTLGSLQKAVYITTGTWMLLFGQYA